MTAPSLSSSRAHGFLSFVFFAILGLALAEPASAFTAVAGIPDDGPPYAAWNYPTQAQADREAKKGCRDTARNAGKSKAAAKKCAVLTRAKGPGFGAFVCAEAGCAWTNGDCVLEYTNGCRVRVQVAPRFDPLANEWKFPPPTC